MRKALLFSLTELLIKMFLTSSPKYAIRLKMFPFFPHFLHSYCDVFELQYKCASVPRLSSSQPLPKKHLTENSSPRSDTIRIPFRARYSLMGMVSGKFIFQFECFIFLPYGISSAHCLKTDTLYSHHRKRRPEICVCKSPAMSERRLTTPIASGLCEEVMSKNLKMRRIIVRRSSTYTAPASLDFYLQSIMVNRFILLIILFIAFCVGQSLTRLRLAKDINFASFLFLMAFFSISNRFGQRNLKVLKAFNTAVSSLGSPECLSLNGM